MRRATLSASTRPIRTWSSPLTTNKPVAQVGSKDAFSTQAVMVYTENGGLPLQPVRRQRRSASYGVNVQLIDKVRPVITFGGAAELTFVEGGQERRPLRQVPPCWTLPPRT